MRIVSEKKVNFEEFTPDSIYKAPEDLIWDEIFDEVAFFDRTTRFLSPRTAIQHPLSHRYIRRTPNLFAKRLPILARSHNNGTQKTVKEAISRKFLNAFVCI